MLRRIVSSLLVSAFLVVICASAGCGDKKTDIDVQQSEEVNIQKTSEPTMNP